MSGEQQDPDSAAIDGIQRSWEERGGGTSKEDIEAYGAAAGCAAAAAYCTGEGAAVLAPVCCEIGGAVGKFVAGVVYSVGEAIAKIFGGGECEWDDSSCTADNRFQQRVRQDMADRAQGLFDALLAVRLNQLGVPLQPNGMPDPKLSYDWNWSDKYKQGQRDIAALFKAAGFQVDCVNLATPGQSFHPYWECRVTAAGYALGPFDQKRLNLTLKLGLAWLSANAAIEEAKKKQNAGSAKPISELVIKNSVQSEAHVVIPSMAKELAELQAKQDLAADHKRVVIWVVLGAAAIGTGVYLARRH